MQPVKVDVANYPDRPATALSFVRGDTIPLTFEFVNILEPYDVSGWDKYTITFSPTSKPKSPLDVFSSEGELVDVQLGDVANKIVFELPELPKAGNYVFDIQLEKSDGSNKYTPIIGAAQVYQDINQE